MSTGRWSSGKMLSIVLLLSLAEFAQSAGGGTVEIQFVRYKNSAHKDNSGYCCETYLKFFCFNNCDNYFVICLRDYGPTNDAACTHTRTTGVFDDDVAFGIGTNALKNGLDNPLLLDFDGAWKNSFSLKITIWDSDNDRDDLVDVLRQGIANAGVSSSWTSLTIRGKHGKTLSLKWRIKCRANYYGDCTVYCVPQDSDDKGHYTCDPTTGAKVCKSGWKRAECDTPVCKTGCSIRNGYCLKPNECTCRSGWTGSNCGTCIPRSGCVNGYCIGAGECNCNSHWMGLLCDKSGNGCKDAPCLNGGTCTAIPDNYTCTCPPDFSGPNCAIDMNRCRSDPCLNNGRCINLPNSFTCDCQPGYTGQLCATEFNECSSDPCLYGNCSDFFNSFSCTCHPGFTGRLCATDINECAYGVNDCGANMLCENTIGGHTCKCRRGYHDALDGLSCMPTQCGDLDYLLNSTTIVHFSSKDRIVDSIAVIVCKQGYSMNTETNSLSLHCLDDGSWDGDPVSCKDIDECSVSSESCDSDEVCYNTEGSYKCRTKYCLDGEANHNCVKNPNANSIAAGDSKSGSSVYIYIGIGIGSLLLVIVVIIIVVVFVRRRRDRGSYVVSAALEAKDADHGRDFRLNNDREPVNDDDVTSKTVNLGNPIYGFSAKDQRNN